MNEYGYLDPSQNQISALRKMEQFQGNVQDGIEHIDYPSYFWLVEFGDWKKQKLYWVDMVTYQIYDPVTMECQSSHLLRITAHPIPAIKKRRTIYKNNKARLEAEE